MYYQKFSHQMIVIAFVFLFLAGCGAPAIPTPIPPTSTPTPPIATPTPAIINPEPGASFTGPLEISEPGSCGTASGGVLDFIITEDGAAIASVTITFMNPVQPGISGATTLSNSFKGSFPITEGKIDVGGFTVIKGQFSSPTEAKGTLTYEDISLSPLKPCDFGTWSWSVKVKK